MTASLPVPHDDYSDDPNAVVSEALDEAPQTARPPRPRPPRKPRAKTPLAKAPQTKTEVADPGPPPPLPVDLLGDEIVIPPRPPLPEPFVPVQQHPEADEPDPAVEVEVEVEVETAVEEAIELADAPQPDAAAVLAELIDPAAEDRPDSVAALHPDEGVAALTMRGICKSFGATRAVDDIDLTVPSGTFFGVVGPNGAGKTTTLSIIAGLLRPDSGSVVVGGIDATAHPVDAKRLMGVLPDRLRTFDRLTGRQLLHYYGVLRGLKPDVVASRTADLARAFDLTDALGRVVSDYSAGMVKKIMLAGAMIHSPRILVLDEPFESVDPVSSAIILDILSAYVAHGGTVILSSHGMELVERVCSRVAVLVAGQVLADGTVEDVRGELSLEQRFLELTGGLGDVEGLEWLHTFSD